jgi:hypothetical protein
MLHMTSLSIEQPTANSFRRTPQQIFSVFINLNIFYPNDDIRIQTCIKLHQNNRLYVLQ